MQYVLCSIEVILQSMWSTQQLVAGDGAVFTRTSNFNELTFNILTGHKYLSSNGKQLSKITHGYIAIATYLLQILRTQSYLYIGYNLTLMINDIAGYSYL